MKKKKTEKKTWYSFRTGEYWAFSVNFFLQTGCNNEKWKYKCLKEKKIRQNFRMSKYWVFSAIIFLEIGCNNEKLEGTSV